MLQSGSGEHVLLTGANGFVASHILSILIEVSISSLTNPKEAKYLLHLNREDIRSLQPCGRMKKLKTSFALTRHGRIMWNS